MAKKQKPVHRPKETVLACGGGKRHPYEAWLEVHDPVLPDDGLPSDASARVGKIVRKKLLARVR